LGVGTLLVHLIVNLCFQTYGICLLMHCCGKNATHNNAVNIYMLIKFKAYHLEHEIFVIKRNPLKL